MNNKVLQIHESDNVVVVLSDIKEGELIHLNGRTFLAKEFIPFKHKMTISPVTDRKDIVMYGVKIGIATKHIGIGERITTQNVSHISDDYSLRDTKYEWTPPNVDNFQNVTFNGYHRENGKVGTRNYWLVIPLVFCENRNLDVIESSLLESLGYKTNNDHKVDISNLIALYEKGIDPEQLLSSEVVLQKNGIPKDRVFKNVDGIKFLRHDGGCGANRQDISALCRLLAGYINHPNVAGATILSLGCQMAQVQLLEKEVNLLSEDYNKPLYILEQQSYTSERDYISDAVKQTFIGLIEANKCTRSPAPLSKLCIGLECGGSDGFSGISANPTLGVVSDIIVALGGMAILSEFPELHGVEQDLLDRCVNRKVANRFITLMESYHRTVISQMSSFDHNPSPGNIRDGIITHAMKSAGAARKGGTSPVVDTLDYTETVTKNGLNLLCTPGNDVESTTGLAASGANLILFTTGLGTPTGNPICPVIKISSNTSLFERMRDIIDFDTGSILSGDGKLSEEGERLLHYMLLIASGEAQTASEKLGQDDFIPWKRGLSL